MVPRRGAKPRPAAVLAHAAQERRRPAGMPAGVLLAGVLLAVPLLAGCSTPGSGPAASATASASAPAPARTAPEGQTTPASTVPAVTAPAPTMPAPTMPEPPASPPPPSSSQPAPPQGGAHLDPAAYDVVVNKHRPLQPQDYAPADLRVPDVALATGTENALLRAEPAAAVERMFSAAATDGVSLTVLSAYRSYATQVSTYNYWVSYYGGNAAAADAASARPGFSEHQTGLALDLGQADGACALAGCFAAQPAGIWAANNAYRFGFIVRYPPNMTAITGYTAEPWHLRYVGTAVAQDMRTRGIATLEQYFGLEAAPDYR